MARENLDQKRAQFAWKRVEEHGASGDYTNLAKAAPALIMANGLMAALAYYQEKGRGHHEALSADLRRWLAKEGLAASDRYEAVMENLFKARPADYRRATEESLAILRWIRHFAAASGKGET